MARPRPGCTGSALTPPPSARGRPTERRCSRPIDPSFSEAVHSARDLHVRGRRRSRRAHRGGGPWLHAKKGSSLALSRKHLSGADQTSRPAPATKTPDSSRRFASGVPEQSLSVALARNYCVTLKATRVICMGSHAFPCSELLTAFARLKLIHRSCSQSTFVQDKIRGFHVSYYLPKRCFPLYL